VKSKTKFAIHPFVAKIKPFDAHTLKNVDFHVKWIKNADHCFFLMFDNDIMIDIYGSQCTARERENSVSKFHHHNIKGGAADNI
jgi:hypothetical protein